MAFLLICIYNPYQGHHCVFTASQALLEVLTQPSMARTQILLLSLVVLTLIHVSVATPRKTANFYDLKKGNFSVRVTNWGATIVSVVLPDSKGKLDDVVLGYDTIRGYLNGTSYFGALVGRIANRVAGARFVLDGKAYHLFVNDGNNSLHGGHRGFSNVVWTVKEKVDGEFPYIKLYYHSFDGEQGFPGDLDVYVTYKLSGDYELDVTMEAKPLNKATPVNLAQHTYWNLGGHGSGAILDNKVQIFASHITPVDENHIPTGAITSVSGTPFDFLEPMAVGARIDNVTGGYDINYVLDSPADNKGLKKAAIVVDARSGRRLELWTNQPGVQFYTANYVKDVEGKDGYIYGQHSALCLETQGFPDSVNHPNFPSQIVKPGETYQHYMVFKFSNV